MTTAWPALPSNERVSKRSVLVDVATPPWEQVSVRLRTHRGILRRGDRPIGGRSEPPRRPMFSAQTHLGRATRLGSPLRPAGVCRRLASAAPQPLGGVAECLLPEDLALAVRRPSALR